MHTPSSPRVRSLATRAGTRARQAPPLPASGHSGTVSGPERDHLAASLGVLVRAERTARGWSARQLAARLGAAHTTVSRLERGERRPSRPMLTALAVALAPTAPGPLLNGVASAAC